MDRPNLLIQQESPSLNVEEFVYNLIVGNAPGTAGQGVPTGGLTDQVPYKVSDDDYDLAYAYNHMIGKVAASRNVSGAVVVNILAGGTQPLVANGAMTSLSFTNQPAGEWGVIIEATNWGNYASGMSVGSIKIPGGSISFTTDGDDKLLLSGRGSIASLGNAQADLQ